MVYPFTSPSSNVQTTYEKSLFTYDPLSLGGNPLRRASTSRAFPPMTAMHNPTGRSPSGGRRSKRSAVRIVDPLTAQDELQM